MPLISTAQMIELDTLFVNHIKEIKKKMFGLKNLVKVHM